MNVFVLCTGRSGSTTFIKACTHIDNYASAHESRTGLVGPDHFRYPENHIEADNRLTWFLGRLDRIYGDNAFYVHLERNAQDTARSFLNRYRYNEGMIFAYHRAMLYGCPPDTPPMDVCLDYCDTVKSNIEAFLKDKSHKMNFSLETAEADFVRFWDLIKAEGDLNKALDEWKIPYNATPASLLDRMSITKLTRIIKKVPDFIRNA